MPQRRFRLHPLPVDSGTFNSDAIDPQSSSTTPALHHAVSTPVRKLEAIQHTFQLSLQQRAFRP